MPSTTADTIEDLRRHAVAIDLQISDPQCQQLEIYIDTLLLWRTRLSLTSASSADAIVRDHILDSLHLARFVETNGCVADIGSGAGFPGVPLAIVRPQARFLLIESRRKRASFLREAARQARLSNVSVYEQRAESVQPDPGSEFDVVTARAVGALTEFLKTAAPMLKHGGIALAMKGPKVLDEPIPRHDLFAASELIPYSPVPTVNHFLVLFRRL